MIFYHTYAHLCAQHTHRYPSAQPTCRATWWAAQAPTHLVCGCELQGAQRLLRA